MNPFHLPPIWLYWDRHLSTMSPLLQYCVKTILFWNPSCVILSRDFYDSVWRTQVTSGDGSEGPPDKLLPEHGADILRSYLLQEYGGIWLDVDYLAMKPFYKAISDPTKFHLYPRNGSFDNDILYSPARHNFACEYWSEVRSRLVTAEHHNWEFPVRGWIGRDVFDLLLNPPETRRQDVALFDPNEVTPHRTMSLSLDQFTSDEFEVEDKVYGVMLLNSAVKTYLDPAIPIDVHMKSKTVLGALLRCAQRKMDAACQTRHQGLLTQLMGSAK